MLRLSHACPLLGYLQVLIMADTLQQRIMQHCNAPGMDLYNTEVIPLHIPPNISPIHILWCSLSGSGIQNHIVPLQKCRDENGNTHRESRRNTHECLFISLKTLTKA
jgi:hypothetical protein